MAKFKRTSIELVENPEEAMQGAEPELKKYWTPPFLPWRVTREAAGLMGELEKGEMSEIEMIDKMAEFVANRVYQKQFTLDDLLDRLHAPDANDEIIKQVRFISDGQQGESKNASPAKKN